MEQYFAAISFAILAAILALMLKGRSQEAALGLTICACCGMFLLAFRFLEPVIAFLRQLGRMSASGSEILAILLKIVGVGFAGEMAALVCGDAGSASLCKAIQFITAVAILYLALPILSGLLSLVERMLVEL